MYANQAALALAVVRQRAARARAEAAELAQATGATTAFAAAPSRPLQRQPSLVTWLEARRLAGSAGFDPKALIAAGLALIDDELGLHAAPPTPRLPGGVEALCSVLDHVLAAGGVAASLALASRICNAATGSAMAPRPVAWLATTQRLLERLVATRGEAVLCVLAHSVSALVARAREATGGAAVEMHVASLNAQPVFSALTSALEASDGSQYAPAGEWRRWVHEAYDASLDLAGFPLLAHGTWQLDLVAGASCGDY